MGVSKEGRGADLTLLFVEWCRSFGRCEPKDAVPKERDVRDQSVRSRTAPVQFTNSPLVAIRSIPAGVWKEACLDIASTTNTRPGQAGT